MPASIHCWALQRGATSASSLCHSLTHTRPFSERINKQHTNVSPPKERFLFPPEAGWKWIWGGGRGPPANAPDDLSSVPVDRLPAPPGFCRGPSGRNTHPLWPGGSSVFQSSCLSLIPRAKSLSHCTPPSGCGPPGSGESLSPAVHLTIGNDKRRQGEALPAAGPAAVRCWPCWGPLH